MIRLFALLTLLLPGAAQALSCLPHSVEGAFQEAQASDDRYIIVRGKLKFDASKLPKSHQAGQSATPDITRIPAQLIAKGLRDGAFSVPIRRRIMLEVECFGPWCARVPVGGEMLAFLKLTEKVEDVIAVTPCGGFLFAGPTRKMIKAVKVCAAGGPCVPKRR